MGIEHTMFRSAKDSTEEAERLIARFNKRDVNYEFTRDDIHTLRGASVMLSQAAKAMAECSGYVEALITLKEENETDAC